MTTPLEPYEEPEQEIRCQFCDFLIGFGSCSAKLTCIYCVSEREFFAATFNERESVTFIYATIEMDKSAWRRGLMHNRKQSIRWAYEDVMNKDSEDE